MAAVVRLFPYGASFQSLRLWSSPQTKLAYLPVGSWFCYFIPRILLRLITAVWYNFRVHPRHWIVCLYIYIKPDEGYYIKDIVVNKLFFVRCTLNRPSNVKALLSSTHVPGCSSGGYGRATLYLSTRAHTECFDRSFLHSALTIWNGLNPAVAGDIASRSIRAFKNRSNEHEILNLKHFRDAQISFV